MLMLMLLAQGTTLLITALGFIFFHKISNKIIIKLEGIQNYTEQFSSKV